MSEATALDLLMTFMKSAGFEEVTEPAPRTYTREDLIRVVIGQQWAVAIATVVCGGGVSLPQVLARLPCAVDVVDGKEGA